MRNFRNSSKRAAVVTDIVAMIRFAVECDREHDDERVSPSTLRAPINCNSSKTTNFGARPSKLFCPRSEVFASLSAGELANIGNATPGRRNRTGPAQAGPTVTVNEPFGNPRADIPRINGAKRCSDGKV